ncbi:class I SAM-dependent methyltransferase [Salinibacillus xinjiangensis]|uniref:Methyltransferase domain-containing protein n=1 Tax=Salinibacillus xinjiangensis TaxID=1229268 RepID=A0A6G1X1S1_9BACI|nr:class I SAM-dependent methyltransferase [Salinibacillus xinjiangensis]MRG84778.1 methyltransferase domain-containing protein [Salinibacillus xinjiangensis]
MLLFKGERIISSLQEDLSKVDSLIAEGNDTGARDILLQLNKEDEIFDITSFRLGEVYNRLGDPQKSYQYHTQAFKRNNSLAKKILPSNHANFQYIYKFDEEIFIKNCPICHQKGYAYKVFNMINSNGFSIGFNPIRIWMKCDSCHHIFAFNFPKKLEKILQTDVKDYYVNEEVINKLWLFGKTISNIKQYTRGNDLLEIGVGAGGLIAVAKEMGFNVEGIEIRPAYAEAVSNKFDIPIEATSFENFHTEAQYDVICMGDVLEHLTNPIESLEKVYQLLKIDGLVWISTPNFESAYSNFIGDEDAMWRICEHINYFSFQSLHNVLRKLGFKVIDYQVSSFYKGSMEVIAKKI